MRNLASASLYTMRLCLACLAMSFLLTGLCYGASPNQLPTGRPNFLIIVADDLGFSDIGALGSEIKTPNIDAIAKNGVLFTRFYTSPMCAPTRSMLLTGVDNHQTGLGNMAEFLSKNQRDNPGYEGHLNRSVETIAEIVARHGYRTAMAGKWHLGTAHAQSPHARGFQSSFALLGGAASHFSDMAGVTVHEQVAHYRRDGELIHELPEDFFSTKNYTDHILRFIKDSEGDEKPWLAYLAYTAPHWPLHAPAASLAKYKDRYQQGFENIRRQRHSRLNSLGLGLANHELPQLPEDMPRWDLLSEKEKAISARRMEVYAAMVDEMDVQIGRIYQQLTASGQLNNTFIIFISDNGADAFSLTRAPKAIADFAAEFDNSLENIGHPNSFEFIEDKWAIVGSAPFRLYKTMSTEGGVRVPAVLSYPSMNSSPGTHYDEPVKVTDIVPTILDIAGITPVTDRDLHALEGKSLVPVLIDANAEVHEPEHSIGIEVNGRAAIISGQWKLLKIQKPAGSGSWELYNIDNDPGEQRNLANDMPKQLQKMMGKWERYASRVGVIFPPEGPLIAQPVPPPDR
jgi:arylsulfatase A-like enzyme